MLERVGIGVEAEHTQAGGAEVASVVADLEADVVGAEHAPEKLLARRQNAIHLRRRERHVEEEPDRQPGLPAPEHLRDEHQMEVVDPDHSVRLRLLDDRFCEPLVHLDVPRPRLGRDPNVSLEVVEERPERVVADLPVELVLLLRRQEDGHEAIPGESLPDVLLQRFRDHGSRPPDPRRVPLERSQRSHEPAGARLSLEPAIADRQSDRETVARDDQSPGSLRTCQVAAPSQLVGRYNLPVRRMPHL